MDRRNFLGQMSAIATSAVVASPCLAAEMPVSPTYRKPVSRIVDTHTHFYDPTRSEGVPWPNKGTTLHRPVYPNDWLKVASSSNVKETVVVEASAWLEDNQWILDVAKQNKSIIGFVGRLSPQEIDFPKHLKRFASDPIFRGIRIGGDFPKYLNDATFRNGIKLMVDLGLELDINAPTVTQSTIVKLAREFTDLRIVINHVGSAGDPTKLSAEWRSGMTALGNCQNVYCKVSALGEQTEESNLRYGSSPRDVAYYKPILDHCWSSFGEDRLIYGSNWPVCEKGGTYEDQFAIVSQYFESKGHDACEKYFWKNALVAYRWPEKTSA